MAKKEAKSDLDHQITYGAKGIEELEKKIKDAKSISKDGKLKKNESLKKEIKSSEGEDVGDFSVQDVILQQKSKEQSQQKENLEDVAGGEEIKKDRNSSYKEIKSQESIHSAEVNPKDFYSTNERGDNIYNETQNESGAGVYNETSNLYETDSDDKYLGHIKEDIKGYSEIEENRRGGRSMLEVSGFEDKEKQKQRELRKMRY